MKSAVEAFTALLAEHGSKFFGKVIFADRFSLNIVNETDISFVLSNGRGEGVGDEDTDLKFMMMKDYLGFEEIDRGEYQKDTAKLNPSLRLNCLKLVTHGSWLVRVVREEADTVLGLTNESAPEGWESVPYTNFMVKWILKSEALDSLSGPLPGWQMAPLA